jgi:GDSL-like Lipase/Acylhydrolase family
MQPWTLWFADALRLQHTCLARSGHRVADAIREQIPFLDGIYEFGCIYLGVNDVCASDWEAQAFERDLRLVCTSVREHVSDLLLATIPSNLGHRRVHTDAVSAANEIISNMAAYYDAHLLDLRELRGWTLVLPDGIHLTARGEAHLAMLACGLLKSTDLAADDHKLHRALRPPPFIALLHYACGAYLPALADYMRKRTKAQLALTLHCIKQPNPHSPF